MPEITFDDNNLNSKYRSRIVLGQPVTPSMTKFLMSKGMAKSEKQAMSILSIITVLFLGLSIFIIYINFKTPSYENITPLRNYSISPN